jgi:hypothetical protein
MQEIVWSPFLRILLCGHVRGVEVQLHAFSVLVVVTFPDYVTRAVTYTERVNTAMVEWSEVEPVMQTSWFFRLSSHIGRKKERKKENVLRCNSNQSPEDGSRASSRNVVHLVCHTYLRLWTVDRGKYWYNSGSSFDLQAVWESPSFGVRERMAVFGFIARCLQSL